jgi:hypothetical protein
MCFYEMHHLYVGLKCPACLCSPDPEKRKMPPKTHELSRTYQTYAEFLLRCLNLPDAVKEQKQ